MNRVGQPLRRRSPVVTAIGIVVLSLGALGLLWALATWKNSRDADEYTATIERRHGLGVEALTRDIEEAVRDEQLGNVHVSTKDGLQMIAIVPRGSCTRVESLLFTYTRVPLCVAVVCVRPNEEPRPTDIFVPQDGKFSRLHSVSDMPICDGSKDDDRRSK